MKITHCILAMLVFLASCKKEDTQSPAIEYVYLNGSFDEHLHGLAGAANTMEIKVSDTDGLSQLKVQVISPSGFHSHDEGTEDMSILEKTFESPNIGKWDSLAILNLNGTEQVRNISFNAPDTISGGWTLRVAVLDNNGNLTQEDYTLHIFNDDFPDILPDATIPVANDEGIIEVALNETVLFDGDIVDVNDSLYYVECVALQSGDTIQHHVWNTIDSWNFPMEQIILEPFTEAGSYLLHIRAVDRLGWVNWKQVRITVNE